MPSNILYGFTIVIIINTGLEALYFFLLLLTVRACIRKSTCFAYFLIMWYKIRPIPRGEFGNVTKKFANRNLHFIYNKRKFDNKAKTIHCQTSVFYNDYAFTLIALLRSASCCILFKQLRQLQLLQNSPLAKHSQYLTKLWRGYIWKSSTFGV